MTTKHTPGPWAAPVQYASADARLIDDLLEALESISPLLPKSLTTVAHGDPSWTEAIRKVENAIDKAKGQSTSTDTTRATE